MVLYLLILLQLKHFVFDFLWQPPFMWRNKGKFGHPGGVLHALVHGVGTLACLQLCGLHDADSGLIAIVETFVHYAVDWAKMNVNARFGWTATNSERFWQLLGLDQLLHQLTYLAISFAYVVLKGS